MEFVTYVPAYLGPTDLYNHDVSIPIWSTIPRTTSVRLTQPSDTRQYPCTTTTITNNTREVVYSPPGSQVHACCFFSGLH